MIGKAQLLLAWEDLYEVLRKNRISRRPGPGGARFGEAAARRWRDYDPELRSLGRVKIETSYSTKTKKEKSGELPHRGPDRRYGIRAPRSKAAAADVTA